ncbi:MAG: hypothetical protein ACOH2A_14815 [Sphingobacteriaceae bacterium]
MAGKLLNKVGSALGMKQTVSYMQDTNNAAYNEQIASSCTPRNDGLKLIRDDGLKHPAQACLPDLYALIRCQV